LPGKNTQAYYKNPLIKAVKSFIGLALGYYNKNFFFAKVISMSINVFGQVPKSYEEKKFCEHGPSALKDTNFTFCHIFKVLLNVSLSFSPGSNVI
jgi:hypothetical protein